MVPPAPEGAPLARLVDLLLRWRIEGLDQPVAHALDRVIRELAAPVRAHVVEWRTLRTLLHQVLGVTLTVPGDAGESHDEGHGEGHDEGHDEGHGDRYRLLSRARAAGLPLDGVLRQDPREVARDACVLLHQGHYLPAARALTVLAGSVPVGGGDGWAERAVRRFADQAAAHLGALAGAFSSSGLRWELRLLAYVRDPGRDPAWRDAAVHEATVVVS
ncbi:hypothetical protein Nocox_19375 [Nonomuraea coxensis DSM 45129]|uniref:Uncharacterized protein n=1 Tax=Nonomuraea coxensis DSM 45129 TaxID=1122611 RepID=A0ABX8U2X0_9ACTN|nr:hypothetical protein [Nonomuraea coxensis]QYC41484.1 hypothetical protein Nocox_19375 [Nonomuraea coxensis DSM 45129]